MGTRGRLSARAGALALLLRGVAWAQEAPPSPPPFHPWRYDEDYSYLRDETARSGAGWEELKALPLDDDGDVQLSLGLDLRERYEAYANDAWGDVGDHNYFWFRALPCADLHVGREFRGFVQLISAFENGDEAGTSPIDEDRADVLQAFADWSPDGPSGVTVRAGRQMLDYGSERLVGARYGPNVLLSFNALKAFCRMDDWRVDALYGSPVAPELGTFDDTGSDTKSFWGVYATKAIDAPRRTGLDLYYLGFANDAAAFNQGAAREQRHTLGSRLFGTRDGWDWNFEAMGQFGSFGSDEIRAWSVASDSGFTFEQARFTPRVGLKADIITGDKDPGDSQLNTFNPLFPKGKYFGEAGLLGPYNLINLQPSLDLTLTDQWTLGFASVFYWRESTGDGIYDNGGSLLRPDGGSDARYIGTQLDVVLTYAPRRGLDTTFSYSTFLPGAFIDATGPSETVHFLSAELRYWF